MPTSLETLYDRMAKLTEPKCRQCRVPFSCCDRYMGCEFAREWAKDRYGIDLEETEHFKSGATNLPFMGPDGCTVAAHLRPSCTLHVCSINSQGWDSTDPDWTREYFSL